MRQDGTEANKVDITTLVDLTSSKITKNDTIKTGYIEVDTPATNFVVTPTAAFDVTYKIDSQDASTTQPTFLPAGSTLKVILTVKTAAIDLDANAAAETVTVATGTNKFDPESIVCSDAGKVASNTGGVLTFVTTADTELAVGETVTVTYKISEADIDNTNAISVVYAVN